MTNPIRIANCSGFFGDRLSAAHQMVHDGSIDVLTGDWLAELTMLILARTRAKRPGSGFARTFVTQMEQVMGTCLERGIKVVSNAGGLDPGPCAAAVQAVADRLGLSPRIAYVHGDDLLARLTNTRPDSVEIFGLDSGEPVIDRADYISANAYFGGWGIVEALNGGADIVITGRTTDAAIVCGPAAWHHRWTPHDLDALAGAVVAGHVIECGTQATGGNYSFFQEIGGLERAGFPWAEIASDGSCIIGKHDGTGGAVTVGTVTSQLLYEIAGPAYLGPDVTARFDTINIEEIGRDRVRLSGCRGELPPATLKVSMTKWAGYRSDASVALTGLDIDEKAELVERAFWRACRFSRGDFAEVTTTVTRTDHDNPHQAELAVASWRLTVKDTDEAKTSAVGAALNELALSTIPGFFVLAANQMSEPYGIHISGLVERELVPQEVVIIDGATTTVPHAMPEPASTTQGSIQHLSTTPPRVVVPNGPTQLLPLGRIIGARSGDKGGNANLGLFARSAAAFVWLEQFLTIDRLKELLPETQPLFVERFTLSNLWSLNFVIHGILQQGVASSTRQDAQAKAFGEWIRSRHVDIPEALLKEPPT